MRNREHGVVGVGVVISIGAVTKVTGIVVVEKVVVPGLAVWVDRMTQRLEEVHDSGNAWLGGVGTIGIRSAAIGRRAERPAAISILDPIVIGARLRIGILDLVHDAGIGRSRIGRHLILRGYFGIAISIMGARELWMNVVEPWQERRRLAEACAQANLPKQVMPMERPLRQAKR